MKYFFLLIICLLGISRVKAQDSLTVTANGRQVKTKPVPEYNPLAPSKAAFYSAVLPGLGQAFNHSYWKIPLIYAGLAGSIYFYIQNDREFHKYRKAYKRRLAGYHDDQFQGRISKEGLLQAQKRYRKNKEISIFVAIGFYVLNIVDANVEAHLKQFNVNKNLSFQPRYNFNGITGKSNYGLSLNFNF